MIKAMAEMPSNIHKTKNPADQNKNFRRKSVLQEGIWPLHQKSAEAGLNTVDVTM